MDMDTTTERSFANRTARRRLHPINSDFRPTHCPPYLPSAVAGQARLDTLECGTLGGGHSAPALDHPPCPAPNCTSRRADLSSSPQPCARSGVYFAASHPHFRLVAIPARLPHHRRSVPRGSLCHEDIPRALLALFSPQARMESRLRTHPRKLRSHSYFSHP